MLTVYFEMGIVVSRDNLNEAHYINAYIF